MAQFQLTISYRFLERLGFSIVILLLLFMLIGNYISDDCSCEEGETTIATETGGQNETENKTETETEEVPEPDPDPDPDPDPEPEPEPEPEPDPEPEASGDLKIEIGDIDFEITEDGRAKINDITVSVNNGLEEDVLLFADVYLTESGNDDLDLSNPYWDKVPLPQVKSGKTSVLKVKSGKAWPIGVKDGDKILIDAEFYNFKDELQAKDSNSQTV